MSDVAATTTQKQPTLGLVSRLFPLWIILAMAAGLLLGKLLPSVGKALEPGIPFGLFVMIYPAMTKLELGEIRHAVAIALTAFASRLMKPGTLGCCGGDAAVTRVVLEHAGVTVGIVGLQEIFENLLAAGRGPDTEGITEAILAMVKKRNYVSPSAEVQYKAALLREYTSFWARRGDGAQATAGPGPRGSV